MNLKSKIKFNRIRNKFLQDEIENEWEILKNKKADKGYFKIDTVIKQLNEEIVEEKNSDGEIFTRMHLSDCLKLQIVNSVKNLFQEELSESDELRKRIIERFSETDKQVLCPKKNVFHERNDIMEFIKERRKHRKI